MSSIRKILGFHVTCMSMDEVVQRCVAMIHGDRRPRIIATINAALLVMSREDERLCRALHASELMLADGMPVFWITRALGARSAHRVTGIDLMAELLRVAGREGWRLFFLGATPEVLSRLLEKVREEHGGALIVGACDGYFPSEESAAVVDTIRRSQADILFVGMPSPFKEVWCHENREQLATPVILPVGGAFDVLSGYLRRAPRGMQVCGMEWLWRLIVDPRKKWRRYLVTNPVFLGLVAGAAFRRTLRALLLLGRSRAQGSDPLVWKSLSD